MLPEHICLVMEMRLDGRLYMPKHMAFHAPHNWWYTSEGGGHQLSSEPDSTDIRYNTKRWHCPGWRP